MKYIDHNARFIVQIHIFNAAQILQNQCFVKTGVVHWVDVEHF